MYLNCPIRGIVELKHVKDVHNSEEYQRINLINFLINKGYKKENMELEYSIKLGNGGRNSIRIDLLVKDDENNIIIVAEVKNGNKEKESAINFQLKPAIELSNAKFGIYYDGIENLIISNNKFNSIEKLPDYGMTTMKSKVLISDLTPIQDSRKIFKELNQIGYNSGITKENRYLGILQILTAKYYDEKFNENDIRFNVDNGKIDEVEKLYDKSKEYYKNDYFTMEDKIILESEDILKICLLIQSYTFIYSKLDTMQNFFMYFSKSLLKRDLAQFYTPYSIVEFISNILNIKKTDKIIDPAGGTGDFLIGILHKYREYSELKNNIHYWDISPDATQLAYINMLLNGDGRTNIKCLNSIENNDKNNYFDYVITNPPFGKETLYTGDEKYIKDYKIFGKRKDKQLGLLFIERSVMLLKDEGVLCIVLPSSYQNTNNEKRIREYLLDNGKIIACISFPENTFKGANTPVKTDLLIFQKTKIIDEKYEVFTAVADEIGFDYNKKTLPIKLEKDKKNGNIKLDKNNNNIILTDFPKIEKEIAFFAYKNNYNFLEKSNVITDYDSFNLSSLNENLTIKPEKHLEIYELSIQGKKSLEELKKDGEIIELRNNLIDTKDIKLDNIYNYFALKELNKGVNYESKKLFGWEILKTSRARVLWGENEFAIPYLLNSRFSFGYNSKCQNNNILTTGAYTLFIENEKIKISFFKFLFSEDYSIQFRAFSSGALHLSIRETDLLNFRFDILDGRELVEAKKMFDSTITMSNLFNKENNE